MLPSRSPSPPRHLNGYGVVLFDIVVVKQENNKLVENGGFFSKIVKKILYF